MLHSEAYVTGLDIPDINVAEKIGFLNILNSLKLTPM